MTLRRLWPCGLVALLVLFTLGPVSAAGRTRLHPPATGRTHVYLMRGIFNVSVGLDVLAARLGGRGVATGVYGPTDSDAVVAAAIRDYRSGRARSIILIGHSLGGGAVLSVADALANAGVPVTLLIALESTSSGPVPPNVRHAVNFYIPGSGAALAAGPGFRGSLQNIDVGRIPGMDHMAVQSMPMMQSRMIGLVGAARGS